MAVPAPAPDFPRVFGRYLLLDRLSRGGMGEVYLARVGEIEGFQKPCIIKKILPHLAADQDFIGRFVAEAQIAIKLQHANVAQVYEVGLVDGDYFLALEFVDGRDLRRMVNRAREGGRHIPIEAGLFVVREVATGLAYAHRRPDEAGRPMGLVHCDVSPPNVLLGFEGEVKLIDFGIARSAAPSADANVGFGKVGYMAPEQLGEFGNRVDKRTDIYAAGVLLFELLTGSRPFEFALETPGVEMARQIKEGVPHVSDRRPGLGKRYDELCDRALRFDPDERYPSAEDLRDAVQRHLVEIAPTFSGERLGRYLRGLFADEMGDTDQTIVMAARTADIRPFDKALDEARSRTVSFALSSAWTSPPTGARLPLPAPSAHVAALPRPATGAAVRPASVAMAPPLPPRRRWATWAGMGAALAAVAVASVFVMRTRAPQPLVISSPSPAEPPRTPTIAPSPPPPATPALAPPPPVAAIPTPTPEPVEPLPEPEAAAEKPRKTRARARVQKNAPTVESVQRKFDQVKRLYLEFERANGKRLASDWTEVQTYRPMHPNDLVGLSRRLDDFEKRLTKEMRTR